VFDVSWSELLVVGVVALVVVGPKDLPIMMRKIGHWTRRARLAVDGFKMQLNDVADQAEWAALQKQTRDITAIANDAVPTIETAIDDPSPPPSAGNSPTSHS
jgi:sec-independent protein translocase protein TatB